jgi:hypothetical protein
MDASSIFFVMTQCGIIIEMIFTLSISLATQKL